MKVLKVGTKLYHPCSVDITESEIVGIRLNKNNIITYEIIATNEVGACGKIKSLIGKYDNNKLTFLGLLSECEYASGLQDFVEGFYYTNKNKAVIEYYKQQKTLAYSKITSLTNDLTNAKKTYEQICNIIKVAKDSINKEIGNESKTLT